MAKYLKVTLSFDVLLAPVSNDLLDNTDLLKRALTVALNRREDKRYSRNGEALRRELGESVESTLIAVNTRIAHSEGGGRAERVKDYDHRRMCAGGNISYTGGYDMEVLSVDVSEREAKP